MVVLDVKDSEILERRENLFNTQHGPRVGDFIKRLDGKLARFSHKYSDGLQTSVGGSWYLCYTGKANFSGGLDPSIPLERIKKVKDATKFGEFWFFHHDIAKAHNGVHVLINCDVYEEIL